MMLLIRFRCSHFVAATRLDQTSTSNLDLLANRLATTEPDEAKAVHTEVVMLPLIQSEALLFPSIA